MKKVHKKIHTRQNGFTLIELLIVVTIIVTLAIIIFVALNPNKRLSDSRDARRITDTETILTAIHAYIVDNKGALPPSMVGDTTAIDYQLGTAVGGACTALSQNNCSISSGNCDNLGPDLVKYLRNLPVDPKTGTSALSGYAVNVDANNIVTVKACLGENNTTIQSSR